MHIFVITTFRGSNHICRLQFGYAGWWQLNNYAIINNIPIFYIHGWDSWKWTSIKRQRQFNSCNASLWLRNTLGYLWQWAFWWCPQAHWTSFWSSFAYRVWQFGEVFESVISFSISSFVWLFSYVFLEWVREEDVEERVGCRVDVLEGKSKVSDAEEQVLAAETERFTRRRNSWGIATVVLFYFLLSSSLVVLLVFLKFFEGCSSIQKFLMNVHERVDWEFRLKFELRKFIRMSVSRELFAWFPVWMGKVYPPTNNALFEEIQFNWPLNHPERKPAVCIRDDNSQTHNGDLKRMNEILNFCAVKGNMP